jgi:seryl-tRNA synthetase
MDATLVDQFLTADREWRAAVTELEIKQAEANRISKSIGMLMGQGRRDEAEIAKGETKQLKDWLLVQEPAVRSFEEKLKAVELQFPNLPHATVPDGETEADNPVVREWGEKPIFAEQPKPHWEIGESLRFIDLARGAKVAGSGFVVYTGLGAKLQRALGAFMIDHQSKVNGYHEVYPPFLANSASLIGTGNLPKFEDDLYKVDDDLYLIPTAEVPLTNLYANEILDNSDLPIKIAGLSACFRREAGAAGKDTRGVLRIHQFDKVEMVKFTRPEDSYNELESLTWDAESILQELGIHYRVIELCAGDIGAKAAKAYDVELWAPGVGKYLEISSCSNFEAYQSRRANIRFRREQGAKPEFVHILNGSGVAVPRLFASVLETFQMPDGTVHIPEALRPYVGVERLA